MVTASTPLANASPKPIPNNSAAPKPRVAGLVLAAGRASRFGSDKRLAAYDHQHTLLSRCISLITAHCQSVFVVTRPDDESNHELLGPYAGAANVERLVADDALHGMGASLANGMSQVLAYEQDQAQPFDAILIALADMPYLQEATVEKLVGEYGPDKIVIPCYREAHKEKKWGNPVLFSRKWFAALQGLHGDRGAKSLIKANPCARLEVVVDDAGILRDIDTPEDLPKP